MSNEKNYKVCWRYFKSGKRVTIEKNLTLSEAKRMVKNNQKTNPNVKVKMMTFSEM